MLTNKIFQQKIALHCGICWKSNHTIFVSVFSPVVFLFWIMNFDLKCNNWGFQFFRCCNGFFVTSWMSRRCTHGVILTDRPLMGRFTSVLRFLNLWIMAFTVVNWKKNPGNGFVTQNDRCEWLYHLFLGCFWDLLTCYLITWCLDSAGLAVIRPGCSSWNWLSFQKKKNVVTHS